MRKVVNLTKEEETFIIHLLSSGRTVSLAKGKDSKWVILECLPGTQKMRPVEIHRVTGYDKKTNYLSYFIALHGRYVPERIYVIVK